MAQVETGLLAGEKQGSARPQTLRHACTTSTRTVKAPAKLRQDQSQCKTWQHAILVTLVVVTYFVVVTQIGTASLPLTLLRRRQLSPTRRQRHGIESALHVPPLWRTGESRCVDLTPPNKTQLQLARSFELSSTSKTSDRSVHPIALRIYLKDIALTFLQHAMWRSCFLRKAFCIVT